LAKSSSRPTSPGISNTKRNDSTSHGIHGEDGTMSAVGNPRISHQPHGSLSNDEGAGAKGSVVVGNPTSRPSVLDECQIDSVPAPPTDSIYDTVGIAVNAPVSDSTPVVRSTIEANITDGAIYGEISVSPPNPAIHIVHTTDVEEESRISQAAEAGPSVPSRGGNKLSGFVATAGPVARMIPEVDKKASKAYPPLNNAARAILSILKQSEARLVHVAILHI
jgi:hypothetical protein